MRPYLAVMMLLTLATQCQARQFDDWPDSIETAAPVAADGTIIRGVIDSPSDRDVFNVIVDPGWLYEFTIGGAAALRLLNPAYPEWEPPLSGGPAIDSNGEQVWIGRLLMSPDQGPVRWLRAGPWGTWQSTPLTYSFSVRRLSFVGDFDQPGRPEQALPVSVGEPIDFHCQWSGDYDYVALNTSPRRRYRVEFATALTNAGTIEVYQPADPDTFFEVLSGDALTFEATNDARWIIYTDLQNTTISGTARVTDIGPATDSVPHHPDSRFSVRPNRDSVEGVIDTCTDRDVYLFRGRVGGQYRLSMRTVDGAGSYWISAHLAGSSDWLRAFALVEPEPGAPDQWLVSQPFAFPAADHPIVLQAAGYLNGPVNDVPYQIRIEPVCRSDWNDDGVTSIMDIFDYLSDFLGSSGNAEFDREGEVTVADLFAFIAEFLASPCR